MIPAPLKEIVAGEFVALLVTVVLPVTLPLVAGAKVTFRVPLCPGVRTWPVEMPLALMSGPEILTFEMVTLDFPEFVNVTGSVLLLPTFTFPKFKLVGEILSKSAAALTVKVAALLVTLPTVLLTTTVNCAPVSEVAGGGVE